MLVIDLIKQLEALIEENKPHEDILGPAEIMIDVFEAVGDHKFVYAGFSNDIKIEKSSDGVYDILNAFVWPTLIASRLENVK